MKVTFDFSANRIAIEGEEPQLVELLQLVRQLAPALSHIQITTATSQATPQKPPAVTPINGGSQSPPPGSGGAQTLRQFIKTLRLESQAERIAAVAYYEKNYESRDTFSPKDMDQWFTFAGLQKPAQMSVAVFDTKRKYGFIDSAGHAKWKLTAQGENAVTSKLNQAESEQQS